MRLPGTASLIFLAWLLAFMPWLAFRSARRLRGVGDGAAASLPARETIWTGTIVIQGTLLVLAWMTGRGFDNHLFALTAIGPREILAALAALAAHFVLWSISRAVRSEDERRRLAVYRLAPRTARERVFWASAVLVGSVAEEAAYRGVGMSILWYSLGNPWLAALICATAFSLAHWIQGWKSAAVIFAMALVMHALVQFTGTLVPAMLVHAIYDFAAGTLIAREALRYEAEGAQQQA